MKTKITLFVALMILPFISFAKGPEYEDWEKHDVKGLYVEVESEDEADIVEDDRYFAKYRRLSSGVYKVEVSEKVTSKLWKIRGTDLYMYFRFNPFLFKWDEGVLDWDGYDGAFYKKP